MESRALGAVWRTAQTLRPARVRGKALPRLVFFTDPVRTPDPEPVIARLPRGAAVVYRPFGAADAVSRGRRLTQLAHHRGLILLAGADVSLAAAIGADGVHLPERLAVRAAGIRLARPAWLVTASAHSAAAIVRARRSGADAVFVSPVFESASPSAGRPLGAVRFAALAHGAGLPVFALGGIDPPRARRVAGSGATGLAAIEAFLA